MLSVLLLCLFSGCTDGGNEGNAVNTVRYLEEDISPSDEGPIAWFAADSGSMDYITIGVNDSMVPISERGIVHHRMRGNSWGTAETPWVAAIEEDFNGLGDIWEFNAVIEKDTLYISVQCGVHAPDTSVLGVVPTEFALYRYENGVLNRLPVIFGENGLDPDYQYRIVAHWNGHYLIASYGLKAYLVDADGRVVASDNFDNISASFVQGDSLYLPSGNVNNPTVIEYTLPTLKKSAERRYRGGHTLCWDNGNPTGGFYSLKVDLADLAAPKILYRYDTSSNAEEMVLSSDGYLLGTLDVRVEKMLSTQDRCLLFAARTSNGYKLLRYSLDEETEIQPSNGISIYSLYASPTISHAVSLWNAKHPESPIEYETGVDRSDVGRTENDAIVALNTELAAGLGPDLIVLDGLASDSMIRQGYLENISGIADDEDLFANALEAFKADGSLFAVPVLVKPIIAGSNDGMVGGLSTGESVLRYILEAPAINNTIADAGYVWPQTKPAVYFQNADEAVQVFYYAWANSIWAGGQLNAEAVRSFMQYVDAIIKHNELPTAQDQIDAARRQGGNMEDAFSGESAYRVLNQNVTNYQNYDTAFFIQITTSNRNLIYPFAGPHTDADSRTGYYVPLAGTAGKGALLPSLIVGLRKNGDEAAKAFLSFLLGSDIQTTNFDEGIAIRKSALRVAMEEAGEISGAALDTDIVDLIQTLEAYNTNTLLDNAAIQATIAYASGALALDAAVEQVQTDVALWLAEQQ